MAKYLNRVSIRSFSVSGNSNISKYLEVVIMYLAMAFEIYKRIKIPMLFMTCQLLGF